MNHTVYDLKTEYLTSPLGLDITQPRFSWKIKSEAEQVLQSAYHVTVYQAETDTCVWDSGTVTDSCRNWCRYEGEALLPRTTYRWTVEVFLTVGQQPQAASLTGEASFETGFLNPRIEAWSGARWIGPSEATLSADVRSVFGLRAAITLRPDQPRAGLVFGVDDKRLLGNENKQQAAGITETRGIWYEADSVSHGIIYEIDANQIPAVLHIYRIGMTKEELLSADSCARDASVSRDLLASVPITAFDDPLHPPILTEENRFEPHVLDLQITGNCAYASVDGQRVDVLTEMAFWGAPHEVPRQLNPLGNNDVNTYPRLNKIGFWTPNGGSAACSDLEVYNLRAPHAVVFRSEETQHLSGGYLLIDPSHTSIPLLRREFTVHPKAVRRARLYATSRGIYECRINGQALTDAFFYPGQTQYDRQMCYQTYDITSFLTEGSNAIGVILASGWWSDAQTFALPNFNYYGDRESFLGKLIITYEDGTEEVIVTEPDNWCYSGDGPWTYAGFFHGEHFDAVRNESISAFDTAGFDDHSWTRPQVLTPTPIAGDHNGPIGWPDVNQLPEEEIEITGDSGQGIHIYEELTAKRVTEIRPGVFLYDMGVNVAGVPKLTLVGKRGTTAIIRYAEILCPSLPEFAGREGTLMVENLRDADCTDLYTFRGEEDGEVYQPRFTFRGCRYIEIRGVSRQPELTDVRLEVLSTISEMTGQIQVSDPLVEQLIANVGRSQRSNFIGIPTDCPQRNERMGWCGDTAIFARTAMLQADLRSFYRSWLRMLRDLQEENGKYPDIAPVGGGFGGFTYESAGIRGAWELYMQYGDIDTIIEHYDSMKHFMEYSAANRANGSLAVGFTLGDWLAPEETDLTLICEAFYGADAKMMADLANAIGKIDDAQAYQKLYEALKAEFNRTWFDPETGRTKDHTQCSYALPIDYWMVSDDLLQKVGDRLAEKTREIGYLVKTGFFGTAALCPSLTKTGHSDTAFKLITQTACPSWLYPVTQGATSVWERWNSYTEEEGFGGNNNMNSFNHYSLGGVLAWMYAELAGILPDEQAPGYRHFFLKPELSHNFETIRAHIESPFGTISASLADGIYTVTVPAGSEATVQLSDHTEHIGSGTYHFQTGAVR